MLAHSQAFADAVIFGGDPIHRVTILRGGDTIRTGLQFLPGATILLDETAASRRVLSNAFIADPDGTLAAHPWSPVAPYGSEVFVEIGFDLPGVGPKYVPAGVFRLQRTPQSSDTSAVDVSGPDRSAVIAASRNEEPYVIAPNTTVGDAIGAYLHAKYPALPLEFADEAYDVTIGRSPLVYLEGDLNGDPWQNSAALAAGAGLELYMTPDGAARLRVVPDVTDGVVAWEYLPGPRQLAIDGTNTPDTTGVYNVAVVTTQGTGVDVPLRAVREIVDPASPVFPDPNGFGRRPIFMTVGFAYSQDQVDAAADALLRRKSGAAEGVTFSAVPHPAHEPGDIVRHATVARPDPRLLALSRWSLPVALDQAAVYDTRGAAAA